MPNLIHPSVPETLFFAHEAFSQAQGMGVVDIEPQPDVIREINNTAHELDRSLGVPDNEIDDVALILRWRQTAISMFDSSDSHFKVAGLSQDYHPRSELQSPNTEDTGALRPDLENRTVIEMNVDRFDDSDLTIQLVTALLFPAAISARTLAPRNQRNLLARHIASQGLAAFVVKKSE